MFATGGKGICKGLGKAKGLGRAGLRRARHAADVGEAALTRCSVRRLARRAGVKRLGTGVVDAAPAVLRSWLGRMLRDAAALAEHGRRHTVTVGDVLLALKRNGVTLYGFEEHARRARLARPLGGGEVAAAAARVRTRSAAKPGKPTGAAAPRAVGPRRISSFLEARAAAAAAPAQAPTAAAAPAPAPAAAPALAAPAPAAPAPAELAAPRAAQIQAALAAFQAAVLERTRASGAPRADVLTWVSGFLRGQGRPAAAAAELEVVLEALAARDAVLVDGGTVYFMA
jgi:histone H4